MKPRARSKTLSELVAGLSEEQPHHRPARHAQPRRVSHGGGRPRGRQHRVFYVIGGLVLLIVIVGSLAQHFGSLPLYIGSPSALSRLIDQRPEAKKVATNAEGERELKESESWAKAACQAAAGERLNTALTASFVHDDFAWIDGTKAYVMGSVDVPNGFWAKLRYRYACELAARGQGRWNATKVVFESR